MEKKRFDIEIIVDTREKKNENVLNVFDSRNIKYIKRKLDAGDYSMLVRFEDGKVYDASKDIAIERKRELAELSNNLTQGRERFIRELERAKENGTKLKLLIEDANWYSNLLDHNYMPRLKAKDPAYADKFCPKYKPKPFMGSIMNLSHKYDMEVIGIDEKYTASYIYRMLYAYVQQNSFKMYKEAVIENKEEVCAC